MEKKQKCKLCNKLMMTNYSDGENWFEKHDTVHVKGDLFGEKLDEVFHTVCWEKHCSIGECS